MKTLTLYALTISAGVAFLAGCAAPPIAAPSAVALGRAATSSGDLLYAGNVTTLFVFSFPDAKYLSQIALPGEGGGQVCSDSNGNVFVPISYPKPQILEYAHGGTQPIAILSSPKNTSPYACAIDPKTGNLAVTSLPAKHGTIEIYQGAKGTPTLYRNSKFIDFFYCSYDNNGNLFVTGVGYYTVARLASDGRFTNISVNDPRVGGNGIQWDGTHVTLARSYRVGIYRVRLRGKNAKVVGVTTLQRAKEKSYTNEYWIGNGIIVRPTGNWSESLGLWNYPSGTLRRIIKHVFGGGVYGATVSVGT